MSSTPDRTTILTVEDDPAIRRGVVDALRFTGYDVLECSRGDEALSMIQANSFDLLLLDLILPSVHGRDVLRSLREQNQVTPVIVLTALGDEENLIGALREGADDYLVKPFRIKELLARIEAVLRRSPGRIEAPKVVPFENGELDFGCREVRLLDGRTETLSQRESELLSYFATHTERTVTREEILAHVWKLTPKGITTRTIDMHVARLREKMGDVDSPPKWLCTVHGRGYRLRLYEGGVDR